MIYELTNAIAYLAVGTDNTLILKPDLVEEKMKGQKALLIMKADYCKYCHMLLETLQTGAFDNQTVFVMDQSDPINKKIMTSLQVTSYPTIYKVDSSGNIDIVNEYVGKRDIDSLLKLFK